MNSINFGHVDRFHVVNSSNFAHVDRLRIVNSSNFSCVDRFHVVNRSNSSCVNPYSPAWLSAQPKYVTTIEDLVAAAEQSAPTAIGIHLGYEFEQL